MHKTELNNFTNHHNSQFTMLLRLLCCGLNDTRTEDNGPPIEDESAEDLSYIAKAAYDVLRTKHTSYHKSQWNVTKSVMVGSLHHTPDIKFVKTGEEPPKEGHSNWFAEKMCEIMSKTTKWCDVMSLAAPDGYFLEQFKKALKNIVEMNRGNPDVVIVRLMFGNILGTVYQFHDHAARFMLFQEATVHYILFQSYACCVYFIVRPTY